jgi:catecholate siderophore receptor
MRQRTHRRSGTSGPAFLAMSCVGAFALAGPAAAQEQPARSDTAETELQGMTVTDTAIDDDVVKIDRLESPKATRALIDTPQTVTVIGDQVLRKQNLLTLRDALSTVPGITFGAGEGGGGYGDSINLRGYSANNDITQDGVRDSAQYSRSETFNLQQIEVYNGANSVFNGSGSVGGTINLVTKTPQADDLTVVSAGVGTDNYYRGTVDSNVRVNELIAVRLNGVVHRNDIPGRDIEKNKRWGIAPSITIGIDSPTSLTLSYIHQEDDNIPVYGVPYFRNTVNAGPLPGVSDSDYFGIRNLDDQDITFDQLTMRFVHEFGENVSIRNLTRWQRVRQDSSTSAPQGAYCLAGGFLPTAGADGTPAACATPGLYTPSGPRGNIRDQENQLLYNQTDLKAEFGPEGFRHTFVIGASFTKEDYDINSGSLLRDPLTGLATPQPQIDIYDPDTVFTGPVAYTPSAVSRATSSNAAVYAFDTVAIGSKIELNAGVRYEHSKATFHTTNYKTTPDVPAGPTGPGTPGAFGTPTVLAAQKNSEDLFSYRVGLNFKPIETVSIYAAYGNSRTPSSATVRLGCGTIITGAGGPSDPCDVGPEKARNIEFGAKADLFERRLQLTAAVFRNERTNYRVATNDPIVATLPVNDGKSRVDGVALGASGNITDAFAIFANYTFLKSKVRQSVSDYCLANPGSTAANPCGNSADILDPQAGSRLTQTPRHSGSLFSTYTLPFGLQIGYGLTYQGSFTLNNPALAAGGGLTPVFKSKDYLTHRAFLSYPVTDGLTAQLNVQNFTNEKYYTSIRNNGWAVPGEDRAARLSLFYSF